VNKITDWVYAIGSRAMWRRAGRGALSRFCFDLANFRVVFFLVALAFIVGAIPMMARIVFDHRIFVFQEAKTELKTVFCYVILGMGEMRTVSYCPPRVICNSSELHLLDDISKSTSFVGSSRFWANDFPDRSSWIVFSWIGGHNQKSSRVGRIVLLADQHLDLHIFAWSAAAVLYNRADPPNIPDLFDLKFWNSNEWSLNGDERLAGGIVSAFDGPPLERRDDNASQCKKGNNDSCGTGSNNAAFFPFVISCCELLLSIICLGFSIFGFIFYPEKADKGSRRLIAIIFVLLLGGALAAHGTFIFLTSGYCLLNIPQCYSV
jgi:hypothetical protein